MQAIYGLLVMSALLALTVLVPMIVLVRTIPVDQDDQS